MNWKYNNSEEEEVGEADVSGALAALLAAPAPRMSYGGGGNTIRVVENTVYYYGDVTESNALDLNSTLHAVDKKLSVSGQFLDVKPTIKLHINSYGGSLFAGLATVDTIRGLNAEVHSIIDVLLHQLLLSSLALVLSVLSVSTLRCLFTNSLQVCTVSTMSLKTIWRTTST